MEKNKIDVEATNQLSKAPKETKVAPKVRGVHPSSILLPHQIIAVHQV
jgi:hypothetical protein